MLRDAHEVSVATAGGGDIDRAITLIARVFDADPVVAALISPRLRRRERAVRALIRADASPRGAVVDVATTAEGEVVGAAIWHRPHAGRPSLRAVLALWWRSGWRTMRALREYDRSVSAVLPREPAWHLLDIVVAPESAGRGVGGALLRHGCERVDADGAPAVLEASTRDSARLYARLGFLEVAVLERGAAAGATVMRRPASIAVPESEKK